ncbi:MAG: GatB/YqeY domain-containing protein [Candidatus Saccharimonadales bacterium]
MSLKQQLERDIKTAMLAGDKTLVTTLRGLKSVILYAEVATGSRDKGLGDKEVIDLFAKEAKKRQESADLYAKGGNEPKAAEELKEKRIIEAYLPRQLTDEEISTIVDDVIKSMGAVDPQQLGKIIGAVKARTAGAADGSKIAQLVKEKMA